MKKKIELLAPAGNYESFLGAIHAGADAVYLGGPQFGARAFAHNFTSEEISEAICYAHLFQKKVYLTINTLLKEDEMTELFKYLKPFYEIGLDGVIIQDLGVFKFVKTHFPNMELHASTQMTIMGVLGATFLKEIGAKRIVPARELSIEEITQIKNEVDIEIECFVHGALCYCYSGQCLFSSILGERSGNRGKCAQPCRLPYEITVQNKRTKPKYFLSLKDLSTIQMIPELIESGIDSFKIEGRMKKAEYVAGVTAIYRNYIDQYESNPKHYKGISKTHISQLEKLYIRNELSDGYYHNKNGSHMITLDNPSYAGSDELLLEKIRRQYLIGKKQLSITGSIFLNKNEKMKLQIQYKDCYDKTYLVEIEGGEVAAAQKRPISEDEIKKQLFKTGQSNFKFEKLAVYMQGDLFVSLKEINEIRRSALEQLEYELLKGYFRTASLPEIPIKNNMAQTSLHNFEDHSLKEKVLGVCVETMTAFQTVLKYNQIKRIYIPSDWLLREEERSRVIVLCKHRKEIEVILSLPYILRNHDVSKLEQVFKQAFEQTELIPIVKGLLVHNLEELSFINKKKLNCEIILDHNMYVWNQESNDFYQNYADTITLPYELHEKDLLKMIKGKCELSIYGYIPLMITANCIKKTNGYCEKGSVIITDRFKKNFKVLTNCNYCYNIIYNSVPMSLHQQWKSINKMEIDVFRIHFTIETKEEMENILNYYLTLNNTNELKKRMSFPISDYTNGHFKRGAK